MTPDPAPSSPDPATPCPLVGCERKCTKSMFFLSKKHAFCVTFAYSLEFPYCFVSATVLFRQSRKSTFRTLFRQSDEWGRLNVLRRRQKELFFLRKTALFASPQPVLYHVFRKAGFGQKSRLRPERSRLSGQKPASFWPKPAQKLPLSRAEGTGWASAQTGPVTGSGLG